MIEDRGVSAVEKLHRVLNVEDHFNCDFIQMHDVEGGEYGVKGSKDNKIVDNKRYERIDKPGVLKRYDGYVG